MKVGTDGVLLGAWANGGSRVLDVGTGTGVIALMLAQRYPAAHVTAIDIDEGAVRQATENVAQSPFSDRVEVVQASVQHYNGGCSATLSKEGRSTFNVQRSTFNVQRYDAIVCNPPFFSDSLQAPDRQRNIARHAETLTYAELMQHAWRLLSDDGELSVVVPFDYRKRMEDEATFVGFFPNRVCAVRTVPGKAARRYLLAFRKHPCERQFDVMTIGDERYRSLTGDFYL